MGGGAHRWRGDRIRLEVGPDMSLPGMRGVLANDTAVFVSFASQPSGGD